MTFYETLKSLLDIPVIYHVFREQPTIPFIAYMGTGQNQFLADNKIYIKENTFRLEYYFNKKDYELEDKLENILSDNGFIYEKSSDIFIDSEDVYVIYYDI